MAFLGIFASVCVRARALGRSPSLAEEKDSREKAQTTLMKFATTIKQKLAKLPEGVTEIGVDELHKLISQNTPFTLADARPKMRYDQAHLPGAINIPVPDLKEKKESILPKEKDKLLVFYCGGYT